MIELFNEIEDKTRAIKGWSETNDVKQDKVIYDQVTTVYYYTDGCISVRKRPCNFSYEDLYLNIPLSGVPTLECYSWSLGRYGDWIPVSLGNIPHSLQLILKGLDKLIQEKIQNLNEKRRNET